METENEENRKIEEQSNRNSEREQIEQKTD